MAVQTYYPASPQHPKIVQAIVESLLLYLCYNIYPQDVVQNVAQTIRDRIFLADIEEGDDTVMTQATRYMNITNTKFPFTAYNIGDRELDNTKNTLAAAGGFEFVEGLGYCHGVPTKITIPLITFFNRAEDFNVAHTSMLVDNAALTRITVPIVVADYTINFTADVKYTVLQKGTYAASYQNWLRVNNLWDIQHTAEISYYEYMFVGRGTSITGGGSVQGKTIFGGRDGSPQIVLVDPGQLYSNLFGKGEDEYIYFQQQFTIPDAPVLNSSVPANNAVGVGVAAPLTFVFSNSMNEGSLVNAISSAPVISADFSWSQDSKTLTMTPRVDMTAATQYTILIDKDTAKDKYNSPLVDDVTIKFTTA